MIVVDTSVLAAIMFGEIERDAFIATMVSEQRVVISSATLVEARLVLYRRGGEALVAKLDRFLHLPNFEIVPFDAEQADIAHAAFTRYGKGSGHPAQLNFGDLFSYALAMQRGVPLLFKGDDFARTDIVRA